MKMFDLTNSQVSQVSQLDQTLTNMTHNDTGLEDSMAPLNTTTTKSQCQGRRHIFETDHEIFLDCPSPLILITDCNDRTINPLIVEKTSSSPFRIKLLESEETPISVRTPSGSKNHVSFANLDNIDVRSQRTEGSPERNRRLSRLGRLSIESPLKPMTRSMSRMGSDTDIQDIDVFKDKDEDKEESKLKTRIAAFLDLRGVGMFIAVLTIFALFADDLRALFFTSSADLAFDILSLVVIGVFVFEILFNLLVYKNYKWSFFFWLDIISTISMIPDVQFISNDIFPSGTTSTAQLARASRASRIGTKAGRVIRVFRLVRFAKLYKRATSKKRPSLSAKQIKHEINSSPRVQGNSHVQTVSTHKGSDELSQGSNNRIKSIKSALAARLKKTLKKIAQKNQKELEENIQETETPDDLKESRVGKRLSSLTTKRVIIIVLSLLLFVPLFAGDFYFDSPKSFDYEIALVASIIDNPTIEENTKTIMINTFIEQQKSETPSLFYFEIGGKILYQSSLSDYTDLRNEEFEKVIITTTKGEILCVSSLRAKSILESGLNVGRTIFIVIILTFGALLFSKDANDLILRPIERMIKNVNMIAKNPLLAKEQSLMIDSSTDFRNETVEIENAIIKIGSLLALGFGDAGSAIIANNVAKSGDLNPMLPGKKMMAIFGFCDIRNFTDVTEVLQEDVMVFVNSIAEIVHSMVDKYTGAANKNIGDAFLLVWKFPENVVIQLEDGGLDLIDSQIVQNMADYALISFLKIYARVNRDPTLLAYRKHPGLNARLPNFKVKMGFGLHIGWAIEGAIGSEFKIDASYLSPNVNMAARLEAATKQYGVSILYSGDLYHELSGDLKRRSRLIDVVTVKGSMKPIELYTAYVDVNDFTPSENRNKIPKRIKEKEHREEKEIYQQLIEEDSIADLLDSDEELVHLFRNINPKFNILFDEGFRLYHKGDWAKAKNKFESCLSIKADDGPTKNLLGYIRDHDYIAPETWKGCHILTEK